MTNKSSKVIKGNGLVPNSKSVIKGMQNAIEIASKKLSDETYGRYAAIEIAYSNGTMTFDSKNFDIEFESPFDSDADPNEAKITIYNLSLATTSKILPNHRITVTAGYRDDTGIIFSGNISTMNTVKNGADRVTTITALDNVGVNNNIKDEVAYAEGTSSRHIITDLAQRANLTIAVMNLKTEYIHKDGVKVNDVYVNVIGNEAKLCGVSAYINKGKLYVRDIHEGDNIKVTLSKNTGMIGIPDKFIETDSTTNKTVEGYKLSCLLQHRITTSVIISIQSRVVNGEFRVRKGSHKMNGNNFVTEMELV